MNGTESKFRAAALTILIFALGAVFTATGASAQDPPAATEDEFGLEMPSEAELAPFAIDPDRLAYHLKDPAAARHGFLRELEQAQQTTRQERVKFYNRILTRIEAIQRPNQVRLSLEEAVRRTLENSFAIEVQSFNPAIERTRVVEAEAAFDGIFFADVNKNVLDQPTGSQLQASSTNRLTTEFGVRRLLPTGAQVQLDYGMRRTWTSFQYQTINPEWFTDFAFQVQQPLLRGFGLDYNMALIRIAKKNEEIEDWRFYAEVRDLIQRVEQQYWILVAARQNVLITARVLADFEEVYDYLLARQEFDITPVQIAATKANLETSLAQFEQVKADVFNAEDRLITLMNDPELNLAEGVEIIPTDFPDLQFMVVDRLAEARVALENRAEIKQGNLGVEVAELSINRAKNAELPKLDATLGYTVSGLSRSADKSFDQASQLEFIDYYMGLSLEIPIGNRSARAATQRARLQKMQAEASLKATIEQVILDVNVAIRDLETSYNQIAPSYESAQARDREVESIVARAERKDINTLNSELSARQSLASSRRTLLQAMIDYNNAMVALEKAKGTLLRYYNIEITKPGE